MHGLRSVHATDTLNKNKPAKRRAASPNAIGDGSSPFLKPWKGTHQPMAQSRGILKRPNSQSLN